MESLALDDPLNLTMVDVSEVLEGTPVLYTSERIQKRLVELVRQHLENSKKAHSDLHPRWTRALQMVEGFTMRALSPSMSDIGSSALWVAERTIHQNQVQGLFPSRDFVQFDPVGTSPLDVAAAEAMTTLVQYQIEQMGFVDDLSERGLFWFNNCGAMRLKVTWERRVGVRSFQTTERILDEARGVIVNRPVKRRETYVLTNAPKISVVDPFSFYPTDIDVSDVNKCTAIVETSVIGYDDLWARRRRAELTELQPGLYEENIEGLYNLKNVEKVKRGHKIRMPRHGAGADVDSRAGSSDEDERLIEGHALAECWTRLNLSAELRGEDGEGTPIFAPGEVAAFLDDFELEDADLEAGGWFVIETLDNEHLLRVESNPYPYDQSPYIVVAYDPHPQKLYGNGGLYDRFGGLQIALDTVISHTVDAETQAVAPQILLDPSGINPANGPPVQQLKYSPWGVTELLPGSDPASVVTVLGRDILPQVIMAGHQSEDHLNALIQNGTGAKPELQGLGATGGRVTATTSSINEANQAMTIVHQNGRVERLAIEPACDMVAALNKAYLTEDVAIMVLGEEGQFIPDVISPLKLQGNVKCRARGSGELANRILRAQTLTQQAQAFADVVDRRLCAAEAFKLQRIPNANRLVLPAQTVEQNKMLEQGLDPSAAQAGGQMPQMLGTPSDQTAMNIGVA